MSFTTERDPAFDIDEVVVRVGSQNGFYAVPSIEIPGETQYWIPRFIEQWDTDCVAEQVRQSGFQPDLVLGLSRGGLAMGQAMAYRLGTRLVPTIQFEGYPGNSTDGRLDMPTLLSKPDVDFLVETLEKAGCSDPTALIADDLAEQLFSVEGAQGFLVDEVGIDPENIRVAVRYVKDVDRTRYDGSQPIAVDYTARHTTGGWLDHYSQASHERLEIRRAHLAPYAGEMRLAAAFLEGHEPDLGLMDRLIAQSQLVD